MFIYLLRNTGDIEIEVQTYGELCQKHSSQQVRYFGWFLLKTITTISDLLVSGINIFFGFHR